MNDGGTLIAYKPGPLLAPLFGITYTNLTLKDKYLLVNTDYGPGAGIVDQTIQYHGIANLYSLKDAISLATLYSTATVATANPAITLRKVGRNGGSAVAFAYDLAKSSHLYKAGQSYSGLVRKETDRLTLSVQMICFFLDWGMILIKWPYRRQMNNNVYWLISFWRATFTVSHCRRFWYLPRDLESCYCNDR